MKHTLKLSVMMMAIASAPVFANGATEFMVGQAGHKIEGYDKESSTSLLVRFNRNQIANLDFLSYHYLLGFYGGLDEKYEYLDGGWAVNESLESSVMTFGVGLKADYQVQEGWSIYGQLGYAANLASVDYSYRETNGGTTDSGKIEDSAVYGALYYGAGVTYDFNASLSLGVDYLMTDFSLSDKLGKADYKISNISMVLGYKF